MLTAELLTAATGCKPMPVVASMLDKAMAKWNIVQPVHQAHFLAQTAHESSLYTRREENLNYSAQGMAKTFRIYFFLPPEEARGRADANRYVGNHEAMANLVYGGRMGNGVGPTGDGFKYRGRGWIQLTGRANYEAFAKASGVTVVTYPDWLLTDEGASMSAGWFWNMRNINAAVDTHSIAAVTRKINGGEIGLEERTRLTMRALDAFGVPKSLT